MDSDDNSDDITRGTVLSVPRIRHQTNGQKCSDFKDLEATKTKMVNHFVGLL